MEDMAIPFLSKRHSFEQERELPAMEKEETDEPHNLSSVPRDKWDPQHFECRVTLGKGNYAAVYLVESLQTKQLYAMKSVLQLAKIEKHPFVVEMFGGFHTHSHILLYLEFCQGCDLMHHLTSGKQFDAVRAKFYTAEVCLALKWFHDMSLLYRNLSLNDILLGLDGHIKLIGFTVSRIDSQPEARSTTFCGSLEFMPPEILLDRPYGLAVDWWQLGIITYQMLTRQSPFRGETEDEVYDSILTDDPSFPACMMVDTISFIQGLLSKEPEKRLGSGTNGIDKIMTHAFFGDTNWDDVYHKRVPAPFVPIVASGTDTSNFDPDFTSLDTQAVADRPESLTTDVENTFRGFEFTAI